MRHMGADCLSVIEIKMAHNMTPDEFYVALKDMDKKYPLQHTRELSSHQYKHYQTLELYPMNFSEAAEMYRWNRQRLDEAAKPKPVFDYKQKQLGEHDEEEVPF